MRSILFVLAAILIIGWGIGFFALKVASGLIHIVLVVAVIAIIISFFKHGLTFIASVLLKSHNQSSIDIFIFLSCT